MARNVLILLLALCSLAPAPFAATMATADDGPTRESTRAAALDLSPYLGKVVYVDFWASWCAPCKKSFPWMIALNDSLSKDGLALITVNVDHDRKAADAFLKHIGSTLSVLYDPQGKIAAAYQLEAMPSSYVYDRQGRLRATHIGFHAEKTGEIAAELQELLSEKGDHEKGNDEEDH